jgi:hypothetical protein
VDDRLAPGAKTPALRRLDELGAQLDRAMERVDVAAGALFSSSITLTTRRRARESKHLHSLILL